MRVQHSWLIVFMAGLTLFSKTLAQSGNTGPDETLKPAAVAQGVPGDRWMEIDLYWFEPTDISGSAKSFWDRFYPLYEGIRGDRGVILNVGWTVGYIMEWSGDLSQKITLPSAKGQQTVGSGDQPSCGYNGREIAGMEGTFRESGDDFPSRLRLVDVSPAADTDRSTAARGGAARNRQVQGGKPGLRME